MLTFLYPQPAPITLENDAYRNPIKISHRTYIRKTSIEPKPNPSPTSSPSVYSLKNKKYIVDARKEVITINPKPPDSLARIYTCIHAHAMVQMGQEAVHIYARARAIKRPFGHLLDLAHRCSTLDYTNELLTETTRSPSLSSSSFRCSRAQIACRHNARVCMQNGEVSLGGCVPIAVLNCAHCRVRKIRGCLLAGELF